MAATSKPSRRRFRPPIKQATTILQKPSSGWQLHSHQHHTASQSTQELEQNDSLCVDTPSNMSPAALEQEGEEEDWSMERCTQTHTVLSYCDGVNEEMDIADKRPDNDNGHVTDNMFQIDEPIPSSSSEKEEKEEEETVSRFARKGSRKRTYQYNFDSILHRKTDTSNKKSRRKRTQKTNKKQCVLIVPHPNNRSRGGARGCALIGEETTVDHGGDMSVYDYQPTPQENCRKNVVGCGLKRNESTAAGAGTSRLDVTAVSERSREEQLSIDREVLKVISQTREEIKALREKHASRKANRSSSSLHLLARPQLRARGRVKPALDVTITRKDHHHHHQTGFNESLMIFSHEE